MEFARAPPCRVPHPAACPTLPRAGPCLRAGRGGSEPDADRGQHLHAHAGSSTEAPSLIDLMRMTRDAWDPMHAKVGDPTGGYEEEQLVPEPAARALREPDPIASGR